MGTLALRVLRRPWYVKAGGAFVAVVSGLFGFRDEMVTELERREDRRLHEAHQQRLGEISTAVSESNAVIADMRTSIADSHVVIGQMHRAIEGLRIVITELETEAAKPPWQKQQEYDLAW